MINNRTPERRPLKAPAGPPKAPSNKDFVKNISKMPGSYLAPFNRHKEDKSVSKLISCYLLLLLAVILFSLLITKGFETQSKSLETWAKGFDYRHCWGKFDIPACHERKAKENAEAYKNYKD